MELLFASEYLLPALGGAERFVIELATGLAQRGHRVRVLSLGGTLEVEAGTVAGDDGVEGPSPSLNSRGSAGPADVEQTVVPDPAPKAPRWHRRCCWADTIESAVATELARHPADVVIGQLHTGPATVRAGRAAGARTVLLLPSHEAFCAWAFAVDSACVPQSGCRDCPRFREQTAQEQEDQLLARQEQERALREADVLVAPSRSLAATCEARCGRRPEVIAPLICEQAASTAGTGSVVEGRAAAGASAGRSASTRTAGPVVLVASQWTAGKGAALLAPLARALPERRLCVQWSALAPPSDVLAELELAPNVELLQPPLGLAELFGTAGMALVPSQAPEAFGRIAVEAMAAGVPVLAAGVGGLRETMPPAQLVHPHDDPAAWAAAVRQLDDPTRWAAAREAGVAAANAIHASNPLEQFEALLAPTLRRGCPGQGGPETVATENGARRAPPGLLWLIPHAYHPSGVADEARSALHTLERAGLAPAARNVDEPGDPRLVSPGDRSLLAQLLIRDPPTPSVAIHHYRPLPHRQEQPGTVNVARPVWETDRMPPEWRAPLSAKDEVWVSCRANLEAFADGGIPPEKLRLLGQTLDFDRFRPGLEPWPLQIGPGRMVFLSNFDFSERKGWRQLLLAWARAFAANDPVVLVLKTGSVRELCDEDVQERIDAFLHGELGNTQHAPVHMIARMLEADAVPRLYAAADAYVSASRGEAWGRTWMEALACGLPTIGTRFGGNVEWMADLPGVRLVDGELVPVKADDEVLTPLYRGHRWGEADVEELAAALRAVANDALAERDRAGEARALLIERHGPVPFAARVEELAHGALDRSSSGARG
jgi:glycosyltransferase involved in cell wall biosynthesis